MRRVPEVDERVAGVSRYGRRSARDAGRTACRRQVTRAAWRWTPSIAALVAMAFGVAAIETRAAGVRDGVPSRRGRVVMADGSTRTSWDWTPRRVEETTPSQ